jgi:hypothetical protein
MHSALLHFAHLEHYSAILVQHIRTSFISCKLLGCYVASTVNASMDSSADFSIVLETALKGVNANTLEQFVRRWMSDVQAWNGTEGIVKWIKRIGDSNSSIYNMLQCYFNTRDDGGDYKQILRMLAEKCLRPTQPTVQGTQM